MEIDCQPHHPAHGNLHLTRRFGQRIQIDHRTDVFVIDICNFRTGKISAVHVLSKIKDIV